MIASTVDIDGIIIPDNSPVFLALIVVHVLAALMCIISAVVAMLSRKTGPKHPDYGSIYFRSLLVVFVTSIAVSVIRWPLDNALVVLGTLSFGLAYAGRLAQRNTWRNRMRRHMVCMTLSFIVLLTAFYVDNGKNLPLWKLLPSIFYWILPSLIGIPALIYVFLHHPLTRFKSKPKNYS